MCGMIKSEKKYLLEDLREETGRCTYQTCATLHIMSWQFKCLQKSAGGYTISEWNEALEYLLLHERCNTVIEAQQVFAQAAKFL